MKNDFIKAVLVKSLLFLLIVLWGGYNSTLVSAKGSTEYFTDIGNILFLIFSINGFKKILGLLENLSG